MYSYSLYFFEHRAFIFFILFPFEIMNKNTGWL